MKDVDSMPEFDVWDLTPEARELWRMSQRHRLWVYAIGDLHLGHKNIIELEDRPFPDLDVMHQTIIDHWNMAIGEEELVIVLGDVTFKPQKGDEIVPQLNGTKWLIRGNHDKSIKDSRFKKMGFERVYPYKVPQVLRCKATPPVDYILSYFPVENVPDGWLNVHGHLHAKAHHAEDFPFVKGSFKHMNFSCERTGYMPQPLCPLDALTELEPYEVGESE